MKPAARDRIATADSQQQLLCSRSRSAGIMTWSRMCTACANDRRPGAIFAPCEHFAKTIFRSCEQSYTDAGSRSAQIYKYRAFQVPRLKSARGPSRL
jgi:hypothetical protein